MPEEKETKNYIPEEALKGGTENLANTESGAVESPEEAFERINGKGSLPTPEEEPQDPGVVIKSLRTFQGDVAEAIKNQNESVISIAIAEQNRQPRTERSFEKKESIEIPSHSIVDRVLGAKKQERINVPTFNRTPAPRQEESEQIRPRQTEPEQVEKKVEKKVIEKISIQEQPKISSRVVFSPAKKDKLGPDFKKNALTIVFSIILILSGIGVVIGLYIIQSKEPTIIGTPSNSQTLLAFNKQEKISVNNLDRDGLIGRLNEIKRGESLSSNDLLFISLEETLVEEARPIATQRFFEILKTEIPPATLRSFDRAFMLGMYGLSGNQPFLIIKISSFGNAFDGMLQWEKTLNRDLGSIFSPRAVTITEFGSTESGPSNPNSTSTATTRIVNVDIGINENFEDITTRNKDARILKNARGDTILLYSFLDQQTLLITSGEATLREIINKFNASKLIR